MSIVSVLPDEASWRTRKVRYYAGDWTAIESVLPEFYLAPFNAGQEEPANPFLQTVMRKPLSATERLMPVGVVSHAYSLVNHREVAALCRDGLVTSGIGLEDLRYEVALSELGEWMNFRIYLPKAYCFEETNGTVLDLRLECFNSVEGSTRLLLLFGWYRLVCSNGLVIGETKIEINERHGKNLDLKAIAARVWSAFDEVKADRNRMKKWEGEKVEIHDIRVWADRELADKWGKKAAARVFHICDIGRDVEFEPFSQGAATEKPIRYLDRVPGSPERASTKFDVAQALSFVATHRNNAEERTAWQLDIPHLVQTLDHHRRHPGQGRSLG